MGTRASHEAEATDDAASRVCDGGPGAAEGKPARRTAHADIPAGEIPAAEISDEITADVAVIGGGVIGHGIALEASRAGRSVVADR